MFEYQLINVTAAKPYTIGGTANSWAEQGWRTVAVIAPEGPGYAAAILIEREVTELPTAEQKLQRIFDEASGALPQDAGALLNLIRELDESPERPAPDRLTRRGLL